MSSSVHFKFKSQKEPSRVTFDGTGISVFELKREIININRLGDGTDFELSIYNEDNNEEYEDDTTIIPRSTSVIARRLPAARPGRGGAARYVSGKAPVNARNASRLEAPFKAGKSGGENGSGRLLDLSEAQSEEDRIKAVLNLESSQWSQQQQEMANATPVQFGRGRPKQIVPTGPERPLPPGYLCYRCREKGHWIHNCPTNNDPSFDGRVRVKRTTGIPRSQLKTVEKPELLAALDGAGGDGQTTGIMVNAEGDFVIAQPDKATWEIYSEKLKEISAAEKRAEATGSQELQSRGLQCPIDKRMFVDPMKTPCCGKTYCNDCITNALIDSDFVCPSCSTAGVLIDDLTADEEIVEKLKSYEAEKVNEKKEKEREKDDKAEKESNSQLGSKDTEERVETKGEDAAGKVEGPANKRAAASPDTTAEGEVSKVSPPSKKVKPNGAPAQGEDSKTQPLPAESNPSNTNQAKLPFNPAMPFAHFPPMGPQGMLPMGFPNGMMGMPMNPLMMQQQAAFMNMNGGWNQMPGMDFSNMYGNGGFPNGMMQNPMFPHMANMPVDFNNNRSMQQNINGGNQAFANPQANNFHGQGDNAYMRAPVNPHRHQGRQKRVRPHDYREL